MDVDSTDYKKVLQDAGMFELNMSESEMKESYRAILDSKALVTSTQNAENSVECSQSSVIELGPNSTPKICEEDTQADLSIIKTLKPSSFYEQSPSKPKAAPRAKPARSYSFNITYHDFLDETPEPLPIIHHECQFELPILRNPKYSDLPFDERLRLFEEQQSVMMRAVSSLSRKSLVAVPWPKPHYPSADFHVKNADDEVDKIVSGGVGETTVPYISRSGRQVKRRCYNEDFDSDADDVSCTPKSSVKRGRSFLDSPDDDIKSTIDPFDMLIDNNGRKYPLMKTTQVAASSTVKSSPSLSTKKKMNRSETIMSKVIEATEQKRLEDQRWIKAMNSIEKVASSDDEVSVDVSSPVKEIDDDFVKRRIVPTVPRRRQIGIRNKIDMGEVSLFLLPQNSSQRVEKNLKMPETSTESTDCPICRQSFPINEVEAHASNCSNFNEGDGESPGESKGLKCELCDCTFSSNKMYETHFKECIIKSTS